jgi:hypothetical protein
VRTWNKIVWGSLLVWAAACGDDGDSPSPAQDPSAACERICARSQAARCGGDTPDCEDTCALQLEATPDACEDALTTVTRCLSGATFRCDADDESEAPSCNASLSAWARCVEQNGGELPDAPRPTPSPSPSPRPTPGPTPAPSPAPGDDGVCEAEPGDDSCASCQKASCCDEVSACDASCQSFVACVDVCATDDDACLEACVRASPAGALAFQAMYECAALACASECELGGSEPAPSPAPGGHEPPAVCLDIDVSAAENCAGTGKAYAYDCQERPYPDCVDSPTGFTGVYCCDE